MIESLQLKIPTRRHRQPDKAVGNTPDKLYWERCFWSRGFKLVAGLDEVGRGCLAGPVVAAAVIFDQDTYLPEVDDSKKISPKERERLFQIIQDRALATAVAVVSSDIIDEINILQASLLAMRDAVKKMSLIPDYLLIDGNQGIKIKIPQELLIGGDSRSHSIGAASIIAKVTRDRLMCDYQKMYPQFSFSAHKGYGTKKHRDELQRHGVLPIHRKSFAPVRLLCEA